MEQRDRQALEDILGVLDRALEFPIPDSQTLEDTTYLQDAVIRCLEVLGEATKRLSREIRNSADSCLRSNRFGGGLDGLSALSKDQKASC